MSISDARSPSPRAGAVSGPFGAWERTIAGRYLRARRSEGGVALISVISFVGIMLAVAVLIITMSVMNGFRTELLSRILGVGGHLYVTSPMLASGDDAPLLRRIRAVPAVAQAMPVVEAQALVLGPGQISGAIVRGVAPADLKATRIIARNLVGGSLAGYGAGEWGGDEIVVGQRLAQSLGVRVGDPLTLISPTGGATAFGATPQRKTYTVAAIFTVGMSEYDQAFIYMPLDQAQLFFGRDLAVDVIEVKLDNPDHALALKSAVAQAAGSAASVTDWTQRNQAFWGALQVERAVMRLILMLIVAIAALNIISGLIMLVKNKGRDIAILRTMGAGQGAILRIFFMAGASVGAAGTLAGLTLAVLFCTFIAQIQDAIEGLTGLSLFSSDVYFLSHVPAKIDWVEVGGIVAFALGASFLATLPPAWRASRLDPVEALRYE